MSILLTPRPLEDFVLARDREPNQMPRQGNPAIDPLAQFIPDLLPTSSLSSNKPNAAALHVSSKTVDQYEELAEITNTLVPLTAHPPTTLKSRAIKAQTPGSTGGRIGDITTYFIPPNVSDHATANIPSRASRSRTGVHSHPGVSTVVIDLTADGSITSGETGVKCPRGRPPKLSDANAVPEIRRPRGRPKNVSHGEPQQPQIKRPVGRPRKYPIDESIVDGPIEQPDKFAYVEIPFINHSQEKPQNSASTDIASTGISSQRKALNNNVIHQTNSTGPRSNANGPSLTPARRPPVQNEVGDLAAALTSAFSQNAANVAPQGQNLVSALSSAFANNTVAEIPYIDEDESDEPSSVSDSGSEVAPEPGPSERPRRRRHRQVITPVTQIPSPVKRLRPQRAPKDVYAALSEQTLHKQLDTESSSLQLPFGVSIAPENESEYMDPDDGVLLDYDSSEEVEEERKKKRKLETALAPKILGNNLRFLQVQRRRSSHTKRPASSVLRCGIPAVSRSATAYTQRVEKYCGEPALDYIWCGRQAWSSNWKPKQATEEFYSSSAPPSGSYESQMEEDEEVEESQEGILNGVISPHLTKRSHPEGIAAPQKKVRFVEDVQLHTSPTAAGSHHIQFNAVRCGDLLQKLVKGKVQMAEQELQEVLLFFGNPSFERIIRESRNGDRFVADSQQHAHDSIRISLQYIARSAAGALAIPEKYEGTLKWEVRKLLTVRRELE
ncbi:hypothetical protein GYMLUDRAFT_243536 [Collybiopsis luxurians FD-317 M1]|uniref:Uncharacterized protein n=1 Tax=Collybiopsis luxurians FD-317 M1 TaxID=944289 RepID=A0A0D0BCA6_9AGAR|nr:hypothetical protein GYMLUDRAFT_243536 [Collybiopsis luxurians FD-317 M1]